MTKAHDLEISSQEITREDVLEEEMTTPEIVNVLVLFQLTMGALIGNIRSTDYLI